MGPVAPGYVILLDGAIQLPWAPPIDDPKPPPVEPPDYHAPDLLNVEQEVDSCTLGIGERLELPPFTSAAFYTQACFIVEYYQQSGLDWPPHECPVPCIVEQQCVLPSAEEREYAASLMPTVVMSDPDIASTVLDLLLDRGLSSAEEELLDAAKALLINNIDLVEWAVCLACTWSPLVDDEYISTIVNCVLGALSGQPEFVYNLQTGQYDVRYWRLYVLGYFQTIKDGYIVEAGATGAATDRYEQTEDGNMGAVIPIGKPYWQDAVASYSSGGTSAMAVSAAMAAVILHEIMHLCGEFPNLPDEAAFQKPGVSDDTLTCWSIQNMSAISFLWALAKRFPCLQGLECFPKVTDFYFMTSEPDFNPDRTEWTGEMWKGKFNAGEPGVWVGNLPC